MPIFLKYSGLNSEQEMLTIEVINDPNHICFSSIIYFSENMSLSAITFLRFTVDILD